MGARQSLPLMNAQNQFTHLSAESEISSLAQFSFLEQGEETFTPNILFCPSCGQALKKVRDEGKIILYCAMAGNKCKCSAMNDGAETLSELETIFQEWEWAQEDKETDFIMTGEDF